ncbi:hypothetical protein Cob_v003120 [Colletotrichum orbiculare MAFF 240422]|uniref:Uncharacterized protein n=1 Tax=Colletotrichum orbiculare (strain 104-T / ATCC 96160 / CBS 514.97 / LARS 414 / MAFF 240422) TaxID=1213857 RepID=A0A484G1K4_COLOR|nr:hypothetical protein Cob_v003120 [Colletotrichum orbiculare MAFF 240422]
MDEKSRDINSGTVRLGRSGPLSSVLQTVGPRPPVPLLSPSSTYSPLSKRASDYQEADPATYDTHSAVRAGEHQRQELESLSEYDLMQQKNLALLEAGASWSNANRKRISQKIV